MRSESTCDLWRARLSERMDEPSATTAERPLQDHLASCAACRAYEARLHELRRSLRLMPLEPTPDVAPRVMAEIGPEAGTTRRFRIKLATVGAAAAALLVLATALPVLETSPGIARASEITQRAFTAGRALRSYHATFSITERGWHPDVSVRRFDAEIWFRAPDSFRLRLRDSTSYPSSAWPDNDFDVVSTPSRWFIRESFSCPPAALPGCAIEAGSEERSIVDRQPFDGASDAPRDLIVPLDSLSASEVYDVVGTATVGGRDAYRLSLPYRHAFPLAEALQIGGSWASLAPRDTVELWVDQETGFPLRFEVIRDDRVLLEVETTMLEEPKTFDPATFHAPRRGTVSDGGFQPGRGPDVTALPTYVANLDAYIQGSNAQNQRIATYADGLNYLKVIADGRSTPLASLITSAEVVELRDGSVAFYRPAEPGAPRRLDIYGRNQHVQLASNLRRADLLRIGGSVPVRGRAPRRIRDGRTTVERLAPAEAAGVAFVKHPPALPKGYRLAAAVDVTDSAGRQMILRYVPAQSGLEGTEITIVQSPDVARLAPSSEDLEAVRLGDVMARWSEARGELEWIGNDGVYRAVAAPSFELSYIVQLAQALE